MITLYTHTYRDVAPAVEIAEILAAVDSVIEDVKDDNVCMTQVSLDY